eukprot:TRINITY_DN4952_c3_g1_i1.p1 TRINITY_DN4952_c3_g1~~TRINITY_DN4952_c3_g1_i1.p1  ORF type:complete len:336 (+),score=153.03 TRINITY_DN4952_c3_g1_i1:76-1083(+)
MDVIRQHPVLACTVASVLLPLLWRWLRPLPKVAGQTAFITGGSEGIGKALAEELVRRGANVVLFARTESKLRAAVADLERLKRQPEQVVTFQTMDVTSMDSVVGGIKKAVAATSVPDMLITSAGAAKPGYFLDMEPSVFERTMDLNYMGNVRVIKQVAPLMSQRGSGRIMIVASSAGVCSFIGYSSYSPSKWALRGFSDAIRNELSGFGVKVSICYPPDTDTPGFKEENKTKPPETLACFPVDAYKPEAVAKQSISSWLRGDYHITSVDVLQNLLVSGMSGITPRAFPVLEALFLPITALVAAVFWRWFDYQARRYAAKAKAKDAAAQAGSKKDD